MVEAAATDPGVVAAIDPVVAEEDVGKEAESHELELARASLPTRLELERSWAKAGVESREFSEPDKIPAEPAVPGLSPCCCCCWLLAAAMVPSKVVMKAAFPAASPEVPRGSAAAGLGVVTGLTGTVSVSCLPFTRAVAVYHTFPHVFFQGGCHAERHGAKSTFVDIFTHSSVRFHVSRKL